MQQTPIARFFQHKCTGRLLIFPGIRGILRNRSFNYKCKHIKTLWTFSKHRGILIPSCVPHKTWRQPPRTQLQRYSSNFLSDAANWASLRSIPIPTGVSRTQPSLLYSAFKTPNVLTGPHRNKSHWILVPCTFLYTHSNILTCPLCSSLPTPVCKCAIQQQPRALGSEISWQVRWCL